MYGNENDKTQQLFFCLFFFTLIIKNQNISNIHLSDICAVDPQNNNFLSWKLKEDLPVHIGLPYMQYFARKASIFFIPLDHQNKRAIQRFDFN